jgi:hypothetical protein
MGLGRISPKWKWVHATFLVVKAAGAWGWRPHKLQVPNVMEIWESKPPGTLWATQGLFTFIFRQLLHLSGVSRPIIRRYNRMCTTISTYYFFLDDCTNCCIHRVVPPDDGLRYARNILRISCASSWFFFTQLLNTWNAVVCFEFVWYLAWRWPRSFETCCLIKIFLKIH